VERRKPKNHKTKRRNLQTPKGPSKMLGGVWVGWGVGGGGVFFFWVLLGWGFGGSKGARGKRDEGQCGWYNNGQNRAHAARAPAISQELSDKSVSILLIV